MPHKNVIDICGRPLIDYTISPALEFKKGRKDIEVIVSTDSKEIADISKELGASVPFLRPESISGDKAKSVEFIFHALDHFEAQNMFFEAVMILQPTSPLRNVFLLEKALKLFSQFESDSLISCYKEEYVNDLVMYKEGGGGLLNPLNMLHNKGARRQDHGSTFVRNGAIYITSVDYLRSEGQIISDCPILLEMKKSESLNIDTLEDVEMIKRTLCK